MGVENYASLENNLINGLKYEKITRFLAPKRRRKVFDTLAVVEEISQGNLAEVVDSTATALSNLLSKFDKFEYKLLESQNVGKYRYYKLSELGRAYLEAAAQNTGCEINGESNSKEPLLLQEAEKSIKELKELYDDKWESNFNKVMMRLVNGRGFSLDEEGEMLVKRYLECVELLSLRGDHTVLSSVLALMSNDILRDDIELFMNYFEPFVAVLNALEHESKVFEAYMLVKAAFSEREEKSLESYIQAIEWHTGGYNQLKETAQKLKECVSEYSEKDIYRYFTYLLPNQAQLSIYIARCICNDR